MVPITPWFASPHGSHHLMVRITPWFASPHGSHHPMVRIGIIGHYNPGRTSPRPATFGPFLIDGSLLFT
jgi:hypothetical protein